MGIFAPPFLGGKSARDDSNFVIMPAFLLDFTLFSAQLIFFIPEDLEAIKEEYRASDKKDEYPKMMAAMRQRIYQRNKLHFVCGAQEAHNLKAKAR